MPDNAPYETTLPEPAVDPALYASIDVGTNSVKMVIADLANGSATRIWEMSVTTRLGEGMQPFLPRLWELPMRRTLEAIVEFARVARQHCVLGIAAVGTAALRDAENREDFLGRVKEECGVDLEVIPGEEEARLSYLAVRRDPYWRNCARLMVIDIGGGSTELIVGQPHSDRVASRVSVNLGAVKLTETYLKSDPPTVQQLAQANQVAQDAFTQAPVATLPDSGLEPIHIVGVGGTLTNLAAMARGGDKTLETLHGYSLHADQLENEIARLSINTVAQRQQIPGLDPRRADIILGGAILLLQAMARVSSPAVDVSTRGLRWGVLYDRFGKPL